MLNDLPEDILLKILFNLNIYDIQNVYNSSKKLNNIILKNKNYIYEHCNHIKPHGIYTTASSISTFLDGKKHGLYILYHINENLEPMINVKYIEGKYYKNEKHGEWLIWSINGNLLRKENWVMGVLNGDVYNWYDNKINNLCSVENYKNGIRNGEQTFFTIDGNIIYEYWENNKKIYHIYIIKNEKFKLEII